MQCCNRKPNAVGEMAGGTSAFGMLSSWCVLIKRQCVWPWLAVHILAPVPPPQKTTTKETDTFFPTISRESQTALTR